MTPNRFLFFDDKLINLLLEEDRPSGGAAVQSYAWVRGLMAEGAEVQVLTQVQPGDKLKSDCRNIALLPLFDRQKGVRWLRWLYYRLPHLYRQIKKARPQFVYLSVPGWQSFVVALICRSLGVQFLQRISNDYLLDSRFLQKHSRVHQFFQRQGLRLAHCILCQNGYQLAQVQRLFPAKRAFRISNPFYLQQSVPPPARGPRQGIAWIGLFQYQKNLQRLYEIACRLPNERFLIAGREEKGCDEQSKKFVQQLSQLPNVQLVGFLQRQQVLPFLAQAKFLLNTSHYEGFSNTFLEAMTVGTPIITSSAVNPDGAIAEFATGLVYSSVDDLLAQFTALRPEDYQRLSQNAQAYVQEQHDYRQQARKLMQLLGVQGRTVTAEMPAARPVPQTLV